MMTKLIENLTTNQYYGGHNKRFDRRARRLRAWGFKYQIIEIHNEYGWKPATVGMFVRTRYGRTVAIPASELHYAPKRAWNDKLRSLLR